MTDKKNTTRQREKQHLSLLWEQSRKKCDSVILLLQGGGALGAYQGGVYEILDEANYQPDWVAGISIGAINAAIIAGNEPGRRVARLREFWEEITSRVNWACIPQGDNVRSFFNSMSAWSTMVSGVPNFFTNRMPPAFLCQPGSAEAISYYDTKPLRKTLERLIDFDLLNSGKVRLSVGAVNIRSGNFVYFDNRHILIGPEHIMASGALPPGFPPIEIDGEYYWDGGIVSNTPLQYVLTNNTTPSAVIFQVDLFSAPGIMPIDISEVNERMKDIQYSSRTRLGTDIYRSFHQLKGELGYLIDKLPASLLEDPEVQRIAQLRNSTRISILHLVYRRMHSDRDNKDYEFSRNTMLDHWQAGTNDAMRTLRHIQWLEPPDVRTGIVTHDIHFDAIG